MKSGRRRRTPTQRKTPAPSPSDASPEKPVPAVSRRCCQPQHGPVEGSRLGGVWGGNAQAGDAVRSEYGGSSVITGIVAARCERYLNELHIT
jgi:hypothetical protein